MATFLTTHKMSPALRAQVEASVRGRRAGASQMPLVKSLLRLLTLGVLLSGVAWALTVRQRAREEFRREQAELLSRIQRASQALTASQRHLLAKVPRVLAGAAGTYAGDWLSEELRASALATSLTRPILYVRGPLSTFTGNDQALRASASTSFKDSFVLCLLAPPAASSEKALLGRVRGASSAEAMTRVERLYSAVTGLAFLEPSWAARVRAAETATELARLDAAFRRAPIDAAVRAAKSELLLFAMDEASDGSGPTELDGERAHAVRVGLVELETGKPLMRLRRRVDPAWISAPTRAEYAGAIDSCKLALEVRSEATASLVAGSR
jgi:hypothetical protein